MRREPPSTKHPFWQEIRVNKWQLLAVAALSVPAHVLAHKIYDLALETEPIGWHSAPESLLYLLPSLLVYGVLGYGCARAGRLKNIRPWTLGFAVAAPTLAYSLAFSLWQLYFALADASIPFYPYLGIYAHLYLSSLTAILGAFLGISVGRWENSRKKEDARRSPRQLDHADWQPFNLRSRERQHAEHRESER